MMQRAFVIASLVLAACGSQPNPGPAAPGAETSASANGPSASGAGTNGRSAAASADATSADAASADAASADATSADAATTNAVGGGHAGAAKPSSKEPRRGASPAEPVSTPVAKPAEPTIHDVCFAMCDKLKPRCARSSFEACQLNCGKYESPAEGCGEIVRSALICARDAADLVCANVAPESCAKSFRRIAACASGQSTAAEAETEATPPPGFSVYDNPREGVSAPMPNGVMEGDGMTIATVKNAEGAVYSIRKLPRPAGKLNEKVFLKVGMNLFGRCSDKMKMQGMVDKPGRTSINYTTKCPDGSEERGLFWATDKALFIASAKGQPGTLGPTEVFLYGFEAK